MPSAFSSVAILGAGTMGAGIAQVCALSGMQVYLWDIQPRQLEKAEDRIKRDLAKGVDRGKLSEDQTRQCLDLIQLTDSLQSISAELVIEAVVEDLKVKIDLFQALQTHLGDDVILCTNTSSIPITEIGTGLKDASRLAGMHFFNPAHIMKLVEIIAGVETSPEIIDLLRDFALAIGKTPVTCQDSPGFIVNRVARHFYVEGLKIMEDGVAEFESIDRLVESSGFRMGPFRLMDLIGVDTNFSVTESMYNSFKQDSKFRPSRIQYMKVLAGHHGRKSGKGFYEYE